MNRVGLHNPRSSPGAPEAALWKAAPPVPCCRRRRGTKLQRHTPALSPSGWGEGSLEHFLSCNPLKSPVQKRMPVMCGVGLLDAHAVCPLVIPSSAWWQQRAKFSSALFAEHPVLRHAVVLWAPHHGVDQRLRHAHHSAAASQVLRPAPQIGCPPRQVAETRTRLLQQRSTAHVSVGMGREGLRHASRYSTADTYLLSKLFHSP